MSAMSKLICLSAIETKHSSLTLLRLLDIPAQLSHKSPQPFLHFPIHPKQTLRTFAATADPGGRSRDLFRSISEPNLSASTLHSNTLQNLCRNAPFHPNPSLPDIVYGRPSLETAKSRLNFLNKPNSHHHSTLNPLQKLVYSPCRYTQLSKN
eukprot:Gb_19730 [translate_table: standard]